ncbi:MAG: hypothetical protein KIT34_17390 [Cyanobacteria bacterium TGS_CYA1]|nr:hypothetical protein [Cyanobacteria bacterium TGS_CYA1]
MLLVVTFESVAGTPSFFFSEDALKQYEGELESQRFKCQTLEYEIQRQKNTGEECCLNGRKVDLHKPNFAEKRISDLRLLITGKLKSQKEI